MKTAVVLFGFLRTFDKTAKSLIKHVLTPNDADLFIYAPEQTGSLNISWNKMTNNDTKTGKHTTTESIKNIYGTYLKKFELWNYDENIFNKYLKDDIQIIANIIPIRVFSMFYHIKKSLELMEIYEQENNFKYDNIILTRPDLAFYSTIDVSKLNLNQINCSKYAGCYDRNSGKEMIASAPVFYYKNVEKGIIIPTDKYYFNDQLIISQRKNIILAKQIWDELPELINIKFPFNPESIFYYYFALKNNLEVSLDNDLEYEIFRSDMKEIENLYDLSGHSRWIAPTKKELDIYKFRMFHKLFLQIRYKYFNKRKYKDKKDILTNIIQKVDSYSHNKK